MEVVSYIVEETDSTLLKKFCDRLAESGFEDFHSSSVGRFCENLKKLLDVDLFQTKAFARTFLESSRPHLFINAKSGSMIMLSESEERGGCVEGNAFEVTCFSKSLDQVNDLIVTTKNLLTKEMGFSDTIIHDGSFDENCNKALIKSLSETPRSDLVMRVREDALRVFTNKETKNNLRTLTNIPLKTFDRRMLSEVNPDTLVSCGIMKERFAPMCKKCGIGFQMPFLFDSQKDASSVLKSKSLVCPNCENKLDLENTTITSYYQFTHLGLECSKGLWLEAYAKVILERLGIKGERVKLCSVHGRDELDVVFTEGESLFICECRDKIVGQNDLYVLAMKVSRINEDDNAPAVIDKVLVVSTEPVPQDILTTQEGKEEPKYIPLTGNPEKIQKELVKEVIKARRRYKDKRLRDLSNILLWFLPSKREEVYRRMLEEDMGAL